MSEAVHRVHQRNTDTIHKTANVHLVSVPSSRLQGPGGAGQGEGSGACGTECDFG